MKEKLLLLIFPFLSYNSFSQHLIPDSSFDSDGLVTTQMTFNLNFMKDFALQPDGKIVSTGYSIGSSETNLLLARYNSDGSLDNTFNGNGMFVEAHPFEDWGANALLIQPDEKIVVAGFHGTTLPYDDDFAIWRFNSDGTPDVSFSGGHVFTNFYNDDRINAILLQPDGKIIAGGITGNQDFALARFNPDGSLDYSFGLNGKVITSLSSIEEILALALQPDGKILAAGYSDYYSQYALVRYNWDGSLDSTFGANGIVNTPIGNGGSDNFIQTLILQPGNKILASGSVGMQSGQHGVGLVQFNNDGSLDSAFSDDGISIGATNLNLWKVGRSVQRSDTKIITPARKNNNNHTVVLIGCNAAGEIDTTFGDYGFIETEMGTNVGILDLMMQPDGKLLGGGFITNSPEFALVRYMNGPVGMQETNSNLNNIEFYPNPLIGPSELKFELKNPDRVSAYLSDVHGRIVSVLINNEWMNAGMNKFNILLGNELSCGIYLLTIKCNEGMGQLKIVKGE
jgi:uncharacterized delta-60 repeat protein